MARKKDPPGKPSDDESHDGPTDVVPYETPVQDDDLGLRVQSLADDLAKLVIDLLKETDVPWTLRTEHSQRDTIHRVERFSDRVVKRMFTLMMAVELPTCHAVLGEVKIKGEKRIEAKIATLNNEHNRSVLGEHVGRTFVAVLADPEMFTQPGGRLDPDPDQPALNL